MMDRRENDRDGSLHFCEKGFERSPRNAIDGPVMQESGLRNYFTRREYYGYLEKRHNSNSGCFLENKIMQNLTEAKMKKRLFTWTIDEAISVGQTKYYQVITQDGNGSQYVSLIKASR